MLSQTQNLADPSLVHCETEGQIASDPHREMGGVREEIQTKCYASQFTFLLKHSSECFNVLFKYI